jgi:hypothetical protein
LPAALPRSAAAAAPKRKRGRVHPRPSNVAFIGFTAANGYDPYGRAVGRHIGKHIAGNPAVVAVNEPNADVA